MKCFVFFLFVIWYIWIVIVWNSCVEVIFRFVEKKWEKKFLEKVGGINYVNVKYSKWCCKEKDKNMIVENFNLFDGLYLFIFNEW